MDHRNPEFDLYSRARVEAAPKSIQRCILEGDLASLEACLAQASPYHINFPDERGNASLHTAVLSHNLGAVKLLLAHKSSVRKASMDGNTALHLACKVQGPNTQAIIIELLAADPEIIKYCERECAKKTEEVLQHYSQIAGVTVVSPGSGRQGSMQQGNETVFHAAAHHPNQLRTGGKEADGGMRTPLHVAVQAGNFSAVKHLVEAGSTSTTTFVVMKNQASNSAAGCMVSTKTVLDLAAELADAYHHQNSRDILDYLVEESTQRFEQSHENESADSRKRRLPSPTPMDQLGEPEESATASGSEVGHDAYADMMQHMWDSEGPEARRRAEYETAMLYYSAQSTSQSPEIGAGMNPKD